MALHQQLQIRSMGDRHGPMGSIRYANVSKQLFLFQRRKYETDPHRGGILTAQGKRESELSAAQLNKYILQTALENGWGKYHSEGGGFIILAEETIERHQATMDRAIPVLANNAGQPARDNVERMEIAADRAHKALLNNEREVSERRAMAGKILQLVLMPCISLPAYQHHMGEFDTDLFGQHDAQLDVLMEAIGTHGTNIGRISEETAKLEHEIPNAHDMETVMLVTSMVEALHTLEKQHKMRTNNAGARVLISPSHPLSTQQKLLTMILDRIAADQEVKEIRGILTTAIENEDTLVVAAQEVRQFIIKHRPAVVKAKVPNHKHQVMVHSANLDNQDNDMNDGVIGDEYTDQFDHHEQEYIAANVGIVGSKRAGQTLQPPGQQQRRLDSESQQHRRLAHQPPLPTEPRQLCTYYQEGRCNYGDSCTKLHQMPSQPTNMVNVQMSQDEFNLFQMHRDNRHDQAAATTSTRATGQFSNLQPTGKYNTSSSSNGRR